MVNMWTKIMKVLLAALKWLFMFAIFLFMYLPIAIIIMLSFNKSTFPTVWKGFTFDWYTKLFDNSEILEATTNTLLIAIIAAVIATIIGTMAAVAINGMKRFPKKCIMNMVYIPEFNPEIITGVSLMLFFVALSKITNEFIGLGFTALVIGHVAFNLPYVILNVLPKLRQLNKHTFEAALDLGATPVSAFFKVILPEILPGVLTGFLLSFTFSLDDFVITFFVKGSEINTLSTLIYSATKRQLSPSVYALSTIIFAVLLLGLIIFNLAQSLATKKRATKI